MKGGKITKDKDSAAAMPVTFAATTKVILLDFEECPQGKVNPHAIKPLKDLLQPGVVEVQGKAVKDGRLMRGSHGLQKYYVPPDLYKPMMQTYLNLKDTASAHVMAVWASSVQNLSKMFVDFLAVDFSIFSRCY